jgi:hypothetical protein
MPRSRIIIDGLDECQEEDRKAILAELTKFTAMPETSCKILVSTRDNAYASRSLRKMPTLCLTTECPELKTDIQTYVQTTMAEILQEERFQGKTIEGVGEIIMNKGQGSFKKTLKIDMIRDVPVGKSSDGRNEALPMRRGHT